MSLFPQLRLRRLRRTPTLRRMVRETHVSVDHLIAPLFITERSEREAIASMPGVFRIPVAQAGAEAKELAKLGVPAVLLFGIPDHKDAEGSESHAERGVIQEAIRAIKTAAPNLVVITDVCLCEYTDHGHCGPLDHQGVPLNDETLDILGKIAVSHARAGADIVAPSGMMDGMVGVIRESLDEADFHDVAILSYSAKYASVFYGPFRDAADSGAQSGDRKSHQMDPANAREAIRETSLDIDEGADMIMVKPALPYLDVVHRLHTEFPEVPLVAYHVSGEYSMLKAASQAGWLDEMPALFESLVGIRRAGADMIITYGAADIARYFRDHD